MTIQRMDDVGIVVDDLDAAVAFFTELGMELEGRMPIDGSWAGNAVGLDDIGDTLARLRPHGAELVGEVTRYEDSCLLCELRGPSGIILGLAEQLS